MKLILSILLLFVAATSQAEVLKLAVITSEFDDNVMDFYIVTDDQNHIDSIRYVTTLPNGGIFEDVTVPAETVMNEGVVIVERNGHQAVRLEVERFTLEAGGVVKLNYLYNGVTGTRHAKRINLGKMNAAFKLYDMDNKVLNRMFLKVNSVRVLGVVGIKEIQTSFQP